MGLFDKYKEPVILKEESSAKEQLKSLEEFLTNAKEARVKSAIENEISLVKAGIFGEETILFELKNSHIPMFVLHDLYLEYEGLSAQIDYLIITRRRIFVLECKNLYGNITVNNAGDFIRVIGSRKEGIYSPITQSKRHLELIKQMRSAERGNVLTKARFEQHFYENYRSVVVLANPKTILNDRLATKEVKKQVIRADHLIEYIRKVNSEPGVVDGFEKDMVQLANYFLSKHQTCKTDYLKKFRDMVQQKEKETEEEEETQQQTADTTDERKDESVPLCPRCGAPMIKRKANRGENSGSEFWGCSSYPRCRGIMNIFSDQVSLKS